MAIEINELNEWINGEDGSKWLEEKKQPLLINRDNLLKDNKARGAELSELEQRFSQTQNELSAERAAVSKYVIDNELAALLKQCFVFEEFIPQVVKSLKEGYSLTVIADGDNRTALGKLRNKDGIECEATMQEIVDAWKTLPEGLQLRRCVNTGGGALGSQNVPTRRTPSLNNLNGRQLAGMSDSEFAAARQQELAQKT